MQAYIPTKTCSWAFTAALLIAASKWKQLGFLQLVKHTLASLDRGMLLSRKKEAILSHSPTWINLQRIMLSEKSQYKRFILHNSMVYHFWNGIIIEKQNRLVVARCQGTDGESEWDPWWMGVRISTLSMSTSWSWHCPIVLQDVTIGWRVHGFSLYYFLCQHCDSTVISK